MPMLDLRLQGNAFLHKTLVISINSAMHCLNTGLTQDSVESADLQAFMHTSDAITQTVHTKCGFCRSLEKQCRSINWSSFHVFLSYLSSSALAGMAVVGGGWGGGRAVRGKHEQKLNLAYIRKNKFTLPQVSRPQQQYIFHDQDGETFERATGKQCSSSIQWTRQLKQQQQQQQTVGKYASLHPSEKCL